jgi:hypothetical protein
MACDLVIEVCAVYLLKALHLKTNNYLYNTAMLIEFWGYAYFYRSIIKSRVIKRMLTWYVCLFPAFWIIIVFVVLKFNEWNSYLSDAGSVCTIIISTLVYYQLFTTSRLVRLTASFEFWIATALILYYTVNFTFLGMLNFLSNNYRPFAVKLLTVLQVSNIVFYAIITCAFIILAPSGRPAKQNIKHG